MEVQGFIQIKWISKFFGFLSKDLISKMPRSREELLAVAGFGEIKVNKYGDEILNIVRKY
ncbi:HRDC domain-containing protein [Clostridium sp. Marseille-P299]|uniref:HRDC domain-containing protein n=1 Tax=Clostridium sp. Marseille-P299 TaxID=1805477 RepID=UPI0008306F16|nr:HRDC domain-containing protein [Clostridium sp. Marseille-P299]